MKKYIVRLSEEEEKRLHALAHKGACGGSASFGARRCWYWQIEGLTDQEIARALDGSVSTVEGVRKRFVEEGLEAALSERPRPGARRRLDGGQEAYLVALASSDPPEGKKRWTMQLLADRLVELEIVGEISDETVRRAPKEGTLSRG
jgi:transposase